MLREEDESYSVSFAVTAEEALGLIDRHPYDLYILDHKLPGMSGPELCSQIRRHDANAPVLFFSAMAYKHQREEADGAGATEYLVKPNDLGKLAQTVTRLLGKEESASGREFSIKSL